MQIGHLGIEGRVFAVRLLLRTKFAFRERSVCGSPRNRVGQFALLGGRRTHLLQLRDASGHGFSWPPSISMTNASA